MSDSISYPEPGWLADSITRSGEWARRYNRYVTGEAERECAQLKEQLAGYEFDRRQFYALIGTLMDLGLDQHPALAPYIVTNEERR